MILLNLFKAAVACLVIAVSVAADQPAQPIQTTAVDLFVADATYPYYRIPTLMTANDGTLIALAERRTGDDPGFGGDTDLVMRRSFDHGLTWTPSQAIEVPSTFGEKLSNPTGVVDQTTGRAWVLYNRFEGNLGTSDSQPGTTNNTAWARYSDDSGATWSSAIDITLAVKDFDHWNTVAFGPGSGIQASDGRLIVPSARWAGGWNSYAVYSDDHGVTWQRGDLAPGGNLSNENNLVQLADGRIVMDARQNSAIDGPRVVRFSDDGGATWSAASSGQTVASVHAASMRWTLTTAGDDANRILWTGPRGPDRQDLVVRTSYDEVGSFINDRLLYDGYSGYSDISLLDNGYVGVLVETNGTETISFTSFNRPFIETPTGLLAYEPFTYNNNTLRDKDGGIGFQGQWYGGPTLTGQTNVRIENSDLGYANLSFTQQGVRRALLTSDRSMARQFNQPLDLGADETYYLSMLIRQDELLGDDDATIAEALNIHLQNQAGESITFGVTGDERYYIDSFGQSAATPPDTYNKPGAIGTTALLVLKIVTRTNGADQVMLVAFDSGESIPVDESDIVWDLSGAVGDSAAQLDRIWIEAPGVALWVFDELRIGTDYGLVVSNVVPEPTSLLLLFGGGALVFVRRQT